MRPALAVTTRSRLKHRYQFFPMFIASLRIRRQLADAPGCIRFASIIAGPREFWTITVWRTRDEMLDFMRSGAHEDIMWLFGKWLKSFWLTRWRPTPDETGTWEGVQLGRQHELPAPPDADPERAAALAAALDALPNLKASVGPSGAPEYDYSPHVRRRRAMVSGGIGISIRLRTDHWWQAPRAWRDLARMRRRLIARDDVLRWAVGVSRPRECYALAVLRDTDMAKAFLSHDDNLGLIQRYGEGYWSMVWLPDNEFGHWDDLRLRSEKLGTTIHVPEKAARAAGFTGRMPNQVNRG